MAPEGGIRGLLARGLRCAILPLHISVSVPLLRLSGHLSILLSNCPCKNFQAGQHLSSVCYHHLQVSPLTLDHIQSGHWSSNLLSNCQCQSLVDYHKEPHCFTSCSSQPSMVHWLSSPIFPCSFVRLSRYGDTRPNLTSSCPKPPNP